MIYLLTAIGLSPDGRSTEHIYTQTIHRTIQNKQYIEQHNNFGRVRAVFARVMWALFFSILAGEKSGCVKYADFFVWRS